MQFGLLVSLRTGGWMVSTSIGSLLLISSPLELEALVGACGALTRRSFAERLVFGFPLPRPFPRPRPPFPPFWESASLESKAWSSGPFRLRRSLALIGFPLPRPLLPLEFSLTLTGPSLDQSNRPPFLSLTTVRLSPGLWLMVIFIFFHKIASVQLVKRHSVKSKWRWEMITKTETSWSLRTERHHFIQ